MHTLNRILQAGKLVPALEQALHARYSVHRLTDEPDPAVFLAEQGVQFDAVVTSAAIGLSAQHLAALPSVKVISSFGVGLDKVPVDAAKARFRPILMTSIAFCAGVVPLILGSGAGSEMRRAMGIAVFSGMLGVTLFGIFLTPVFYALLRSRRRARHSTTAPRAAVQGASHE